MHINLSWLDKFSLPILLIMAAFLGLAPFSPEPHIWQKLTMLASDNLHKPIDIFDLFLHGTPWILLGLKLVRLRMVSTGK